MKNFKTVAVLTLLAASIATAPAGATTATATNTSDTRVYDEQSGILSYPEHLSQKLELYLERETEDFSVAFQDTIQCALIIGDVEKLHFTLKQIDKSDSFSGEEKMRILGILAAEGMADIAKEHSSADKLSMNASGDNLKPDVLGPYKAENSIEKLVDLLETIDELAESKEKLNTSAESCFRALSYINTAYERLINPGSVIEDKAEWANTSIHMADHALEFLKLYTSDRFEELTFGYSEGETPDKPNAKDHEL